MSRTWRTSFDNSRDEACSLHQTEELPRPGAKRLLQELEAAQPWVAAGELPRLIGEPPASCGLLRLLPHTGAVRRLPVGPTDCLLSSMSSFPVLRGTAGSGGCPRACALLPVLLALLAGGARGELLGTHPHRNGTVHLMTELCREGNPGAGQRAWQTVDGRERHGCWGVDRAGNPVVTWSDGSELQLNGDKVKLSRRIAAVLEERATAPRPPSPPSTSAPTVLSRAELPRAAAPERPSPSAAPARDFARPAWCAEARFPHERLVCTDAELADRDLHLAALWRPYRRTLSRGAEAWHKSDYFRRLKACGADKACIVSEQETQMRRYREGLLDGG